METEYTEDFELKEVRGVKEVKERREFEKSRAARYCGSFRLTNHPIHTT